MSCHYSLSAMNNSENELENVLEHAYHLLHILNDSQLDLDKLNSYVYSIFYKPNTVSLFSFICNMIYIGVSENITNYKRLTSHSNTVCQFYQKYGKQAV